MEKPYNLNYETDDQQSGTHVFLYNKYITNACQFTSAKKQTNNNLIFKIMEKKQFTETYPKIHKDKENIFTIVEMKKNQFRIALGNEIVVEKTFKTKNEAQQHIDQKNWEMMLNVLCVATKRVVEQLKQQDNEKTE